ncbi:MAG: hypothetical protein ACLPSH_04030 [Vulcanimicrobiaceae bacterium]
MALTCAVALGATLPALARAPGPMDTGMSNDASMSSAASGSKIYNIGAQNGSNETGTVTLGSHGPNKTVVSVDIQGAPAGDLQPVHIHTGTCANLDPTPAYPLNNLTAGHSRTVVNVPLGKLLAGGYAGNVHQSLTDVKDYVACGDLTPANAASSSAYPEPTATAKGGH